jgi:hypothetical protein
MKKKKETGASAYKGKTTAMIGFFIGAWNQRPIATSSTTNDSSTIVRGKNTVKHRRRIREEEGTKKKGITQRSREEELLTDRT